jgi:hypothetical protein
VVIKQFFDVSEKDIVHGKIQGIAEMLGIFPLPEQRTQKASIEF